MEARATSTDWTTSLQGAVWLAVGFGLLKLTIQLLATLYTLHIGYGYFRDELYYMMCGRLLDWGYVDHSPLVAVQARLAMLLFGKSLFGIRFFSALAGGGRVFLTGLLAWSLGGRRAAQALAMLAVVVAPCYLGGDGYLSMNSFESLFWMGCVLTVVMITRGATPRWWLLVGVLAGAGLENKPSMTFFLLALVAGLLVTPQRRFMLNRWFALAIAVTVLLALPNLLWQVHHQWPTLEFLHNGRVENKNVVVGPVGFVLGQILTLHPLNVFVWGAGLIWLLTAERAKGFRWIGATYLFFLLGMIALHAKDYYVVPAYPMLFAAGGLAWAGPTPLSGRRGWRIPALVCVLVITGALIFPMASPVLPPEPWLRYTRAMHLSSQQQENLATGPLPQFYADRFGWQELADQVEKIYHELPPEDRAVAGIYCSNYGEASAVNLLANGLPFAASGQNNYYLWGPQGYSGAVMIMVTGATEEEMRENYRDVKIAGEMDNPYSMSFEHRHIYLVRGRTKNFSADWAEFKHYI